MIIEMNRQEQRELKAFHDRAIKAGMKHKIGDYQYYLFHVQSNNTFRLLKDVSSMEGQQLSDQPQIIIASWYQYIKFFGGEAKLRPAKPSQSNKKN